MSKEAMKLAQEIAAQYNKAERFQTWTYDFMMQRLMELVTVSATVEREACAKVCDDKHDTWRWDDEADSASGPRDCAAAIRARGQA